MLAFVPTITGAAVGLLGDPRPAAELIGISLLGLVATLGIFVYELRNAQPYDALVQRARELERLLGLPTVQGLHGAGGVLARPGRWFAHDRGWALVYSAAIAGWSYLAAWGFLSVDAGRQRADGRRGDRDRGRSPRRRRPRAVSAVR